MSKKKQDKNTVPVAIEEIISPNLPPPSEIFKAFQCGTESPILIPVNPTKAIISKLLEAEPLTTRKESEPPNTQEFRNAIMLQIPDIPEDDLQIAIETRKRQHDIFLAVKMRDRKERIEPVKEIFPYLTNEEIIEIINQEEEEINNYYDKLEDWGFLTELRKKIAIRYTSMEESVPAAPIVDVEPIQDVDNDDDQDEYEEPTEIEMDIDDEIFPTSKRSKKSHNNENAKKSKKPKAKSARGPLFATPESNSEDEIVSEENSLASFDDYVPFQSRKRKRTSSKKLMRLKLDEAIQNSDTFEGWSKARIQAYKAIERNPNAYYYRFNAPGIPQKHGPWTPEEHEIFMNCLKKFDVSAPKWGIFSQSIPGRVGYQCANYYRYLVKEGLIQDSNYIVEKGKVRMMKKSSKAKVDLEEGGIKNDFNSTPFRRDTRNPLPGFMDCITKDEVVNPYLSPYGHVLGYDTWRRILNPNVEDSDRFVKNQCPFTKQKLSKRSLIQLTMDNIEEYRSKILHI